MDETLDQKVWILHKKDKFSPPPFAPKRSWDVRRWFCVSMGSMFALQVSERITAADESNVTFVATS